MTKKNPNSSIRSGYKYEDLYVLQLCVEWLSEAEKFKGIKIQYVPDGTKGFAIDDIVVEFPDGTSSFYQLKYKQNPFTDLWDFNHLIEKGLFRWISSYGMLERNEKNYCSLITNGEPAADVSLCLNGDKISLADIRLNFPDIEIRLTQKFTDNALLHEFFANFQFVFCQPDKYELEDKLRTTLYDNLKVTKAGVDSLMLYIGNQGSEQFPKVMTLDDIRKYLSWDNPRPLNQNFYVPSDFEFFNQHSHQEILHELRSPEGGLKIFTGKPGAGKSTYLSKLYEILDREKIPVFRHHYHLNPKDYSQFERLNTERVKEALRASFKKEKSQVLKELGQVNTEHTPLREFISKIASHYAKQGKSFVLIIDGLDHVIREGNSESQLQEFISEIFYPQEGYWLLLGTQEMAVKCLPNSIFKFSPEETWIEIKGLSKANVTRIVKSNIREKKQENVREIDKSFFNKIFEITAGNPLHLRYVMGEIISSEGDILFHDLDKIPPYKGDIKTYYEDIWRILSDEAKTFCFSLCTLDFKLHKEQLIQLGSYFSRYPAEVTKCFKEIRHLIFSELSGISVYHNSFSVFIKEQPELKEQQLLLYRSIRQWLNDYDNEGLKWSELSKIEYYLGNPELLLSMDKEWLINSYLQCRDEDQIQNLLNLATEAAFKAGDFKKNIFFGEVSRRFENRSYSLWDDNLHKIWVTSFRSNPDIFIKYPDFSRLTYYQIKELLIALKDRGMLEEIPEAAIDRMNLLFQDQNIEKSKIVEAWLEILLRFESTSDQKILEFLKQFRKGDRSESYFAFYVGKILEDHRRYGFRLETLLKSKLTNQEKKRIKSVFINHDLMNGRFDWKERISVLPKDDGYKSKIYRYLGNRTLPSEMLLLSRDEFPDVYSFTSKDDDSWQLWLNQFYKSLFLSLAGSSEQISVLPKSKEDDKQTRLLQAVVVMGSGLGEKFIRKEKILVDEILKPLDAVHELDFYKDHDLFELRRSFLPMIINEIIWLSHVFNTHHDFDAEIEVAEIKTLINHPWYYQSRLFDLLHDKKVKLSEKAFCYFADHEIDKIKDELVEFKDKTEKMVNLSILAADLGHEIVSVLLYHAAENIIAYSNHKDMLLYDVILGIRKLNEAGSKKVKGLLRRISPYIYHIEKLTDGDETGSFIYEYSAELAAADIPALYSFYYSSLQKRDYYLSENLFGDILKTLDFSDRISCAIGATAVGDSSYNELLELATKDAKANVVLADIQTKLGTIDYGREADGDAPRSKRENVAGKVYAKITAETIIDHLNSIGKSTFGNYERSSFISGWAKYWLERSDANRKVILGKIKEIIQDDFVETEYKLLDFLYPFAKSIDSGFAFQCICWAQSNSGGWSSDYFSKPEEDRERWKKVIKDYPKRTYEFFILSVNNSGLRYNKTNNKNYTVSAPKLIQFMIDSGKINIAEDIAGYYLEMLPLLFPNVQLPEPEFYSIDKKIELFDILLTRLEWISPIVRERAAKEIVDILSKDEEGVYHQKYFTWLGGQFLESRISEALLFLLLSVQKDKSCSRKYITSEKLVRMISIRCMATDLIMEAIAEELGFVFKPTEPAYVSISFGTVRRDFAEFEKLVGTNLPLIFLNYIDELQENVPFEIWKCWSTLFDDYCNLLEVEYQRDDERYKNDFSGVMIGRATIFSEILRSTFFKLLDYSYFEGFITIQDLFTYTVANFTIEPSVWSINLATKPLWWPKVATPKLTYNERPPELRLELSHILSSAGTHQVLSLNGVFSNTTNFYHGDYFYGLKILPFVYPRGAENNFEAAKIFREIEENSGIWYPGIKRMQNFGVFSNELKFIERKKNNIRNGTSVIPLVAPVKSLNTNMLQYYRAFYPVKLLTPYIKETLELKTDQGCLQYLKHEEIVCMHQDFLDGLRDSSDIRGLLPYGTFLSLDKSYLLKFLKDKNLSFAYAVKQTLYTKEHSGRGMDFDREDEYLIVEYEITDKVDPK